MGHSIGRFNTTVTKYNLDDLEAIADLMEAEDICLWSVFFLVPTGRGQTKDLISAKEHEQVFNFLYDLTKTAPYDIKTTSAQHYRRVVMQRKEQEMKAAALAGTGPDNQSGASPATPGFFTGDGASADMIGRAAKGVNDGNGFVFISHLGEVMPSGFLPVSGGNVRDRSLADIYRNSQLFKDLRNPDKYKGKCGWCEYKYVCGGSRARVYGLTGDYMESEPYCVYHPKKPEGWQEYSESA